MLEGSTTASSYKYDGRTNPECSSEVKSLTKHVRGIRSVDMFGNPNRLMRYMRERNSPIAITIDASYIGITNYDGGVIDGRQLGSSVTETSVCTSNRSDHTVTLVGYELTGEMKLTRLYLGDIAGIPIYVPLRYPAGAWKV